ncbi:hypothetical protein ACIWO4_07755 [Avibacterium paragallinarum]|uniref:hypothetical protein n=1 Tax=Avibacterium paragallinarum TaxID=728 RepID=UPI003985D2F2
MFNRKYNKRDNKKMIIYFDVATLPSLNMIFDLLKQKENNEIERIVGFSRFELDETILKHFPDNKISFHKVDLDSKLELFAKKILEIIKNSPTKYALTIHTNLCHSLVIIPKLMSILNLVKHKYYIEQLYLYDDGSSDYLDLYNQRDNNLALLFKTAKKNTSLRLKQEIIYYFPRVHPYRLIYKVIRKFKFLRKYFHFTYLNKYTWHTLFPTKYIVLCPEYFETDKKMSYINKELEKHFTKMNFQKFHTLTSENKSLFLHFINIDSQQLHTLARTLKQKNTLILTGTTTWKDERLEFAKLQANLLKNLIDTNFKNYHILFKGHPAATDINTFIIDTLKIESIPENIPLEILIILDLLPDTICGMPSSIYFSLPKEKVGKLIFLENKYIENTNPEKLTKFEKLISVILKINTNKSIELLKNKQNIIK